MSNIAQDARESMNHFEKAEEFLRDAETEFRLVRDGVADPSLVSTYLQSASFRLSLAQAHIGLAQVQEYGQVQGTVEKMVDKLPEQTTEEKSKSYSARADVAAAIRESVTE